MDCQHLVYADKYTNTFPCGFSASYSPSCMAVAILFMVAMTEVQDCRSNSKPFTPWTPYTFEKQTQVKIKERDSVNLQHIHLLIQQN